MKAGSTREILSDLVGFNTVSSRSNLDLVRYVKDYLNSFGVESTLIFDATGEKANLLATVGPMAEGGVVLSGHTDVVPAMEDHWTNDPWSLVERDGRLYGRGTCDMKGFLASVLAAVPAMLSAGIRHPVHIAFSYDEEVGCKGAPSLVEAIAHHIPKPRAVIVGEPSMMRPVTGHKGSFSFFTDVHGHSVHSSRLDIGVSAVMVAARLIDWLARANEANRRAAAANSPFLPPYTTVHCGMVSGGIAANVVASHCQFVTDIRPLPGEDPRDCFDRFIAFCRDEVEPAMKAIAPHAGTATSLRSSVPALKPDDGGSAEALVYDLLSTCSAECVSYTTEAGIFQRAGLSTIVVGPGSIEQAHQHDEYIAISQLDACDAFLANLIGTLR